MKIFLLTAQYPHSKKKNLCAIHAENAEAAAAKIGGSVIRWWGGQTVADIINFGIGYADFKPGSESVALIADIIVSAMGNGAEKLYGEAVRTEVQSIIRDQSASLMLAILPLAK